MAAELARDEASEERILGLAMAEHLTEVGGTRAG
jgi:hypothetical protein